MIITKKETLITTRDTLIITLLVWPLSRIRDC